LVTTPEESWIEKDKKGSKKSAEELKRASEREHMTKSELLWFFVERAKMEAAPRKKRETKNNIHAFHLNLRTSLHDVELAVLVATFDILRKPAHEFLDRLADLAHANHEPLAQVVVEHERLF